MRRAGAPPIRALWVLGIALAMVAGCGRRGSPREGPLTFERLADTTGLSQGLPVFAGVELYRIAGDALRVKGLARLPDGTRLRLSLLKPGHDNVTAEVVAEVTSGAFDSPPLFGERGPLPITDWRLEVCATFAPGDQPMEVMESTNDGRALRGPGVTRTQIGGAAVYQVLEFHR